MTAERRGRDTTSLADAESWEAMLDRMVLDAVSEACSEGDLTEEPDGRRTDGSMEWNARADGRRQSETENPVHDPAEAFLNRAAAFLKSREDGPELLARLRGMLVGDGPDVAAATTPTAKTVPSDDEAEDP